MESHDISFVNNNLGNCVEEQEIDAYKTLRDAVEEEMTKNIRDMTAEYISNTKKNLNQHARLAGSQF